MGQPNLFLWGNFRENNYNECKVLKLQKKTFSVYVFTP